MQKEPNLFPRNSQDRDSNVSTKKIYELVDLDQS